MPFIPTPNGIKVCLRFTKAGQQVCNVFHVMGPSSVTVTDLETIAGIFVSAWNDHMKAVTTPDVSLDAVEVVDISTAGGLGIEYTTGLPLTGTSSGNPTPNNVTVATKLLTGRTGRSYRGRSYAVGLSTNNLGTNAQTITSAMATVLSSFFAELITNLATSDFPLAVLSLFTGGAPRTSGVLTEVNGTSTNLTLDSQRRRLPERGA